MNRVCQRCLALGFSAGILGGMFTTLAQSPKSPPPTVNPSTEKGSSRSSAAQSPKTLPPSVRDEVKRQELARIDEQLNDPDCIKSEVAMQSVVEAGEADKIEHAQRTAFTTGNACVRGIAMRSYLARVGEVTFGIQLPSPVQERLERAQKSADPEALASLEKTYSYLGVLKANGYKLHLIFKDYDMSKNRGKVLSPYGKLESSFAVSGDRVSMEVPYTQFSQGLLDFRPQNLTNTDNGLVLTGSMSLKGGGISSPPLTITVPILVGVVPPVRGERK